MLINFNRLGKVASVTVLTLGVAFAAQPAQKADAQTAIVGAGSDTVTTIFDDNNPAPASEVWGYANGFGEPYRYVVTGSGAGRIALLNGQTFAGQRVDFAATDGIGTTFGANTAVRNNTIINTVNNQPVIDPLTGVPYVVINEADVKIAFAFNVPSFDVFVNEETLCRIFRGNATLGDPTNWNQVVNQANQRGPNLPIRRVGYGDANGQTDVLQGLTNAPIITTNFGFVQLCNGQVKLPNGTPIAAPPTFVAPNLIPSIVPAAPNGFDNGTLIPNRRLGAIGDIIVNAASPTGNSPADPFGRASGKNDDNNPLSYALGLLKTVKNTQGAIGYVETAIAQANGFYPVINDARYVKGNGLGLAVGFDIFINGRTIPTSTVAFAPTYVIFRGNYLTGGPGTAQDINKVITAQDVCWGSIWSSFLSNNSAAVYPKQAGFNINTTGGAFPYIIDPISSSQAGADTDNYGSYGTLFGGNDFGPCSRIGGFSPANQQTLSATLSVSGSTRTLSSITLLGSNPPIAAAPVQTGDIINATTSSGTVVRGTVLSVNASARTLQLYVNLSNLPGITFMFDPNKSTPPNSVYTFNF